MNQEYRKYQTSAVISRDVLPKVWVGMGYTLPNKTNTIKPNQVTLRENSNFVKWSDVKKKD